MKHFEIRDKFRKFFESKNHKWVESSSLLPNDPSVLFTTAGMQQFKPYYVGGADPMKDFGSLNTASIQKCVRTSDVDEVGDERHLTFFEMLGNFSFGGYFKKEAITWAHEFITSPEWMNLNIDYVTVFEGEEGVPADTESEEIWKKLGVSDIRKSGCADNFWGPTGDEGPCGPTTEIYVDGIEIWNIVFNQYYQNKDKTLKPLETPGIDTGMGLERLALVSQFPGQVGEKTVFETDLLQPIMASIGTIGDIKSERIRLIADHIRSLTFLVADGIIPGKEERNYIPRRLFRDAMTSHYLFAGFGLDTEFFDQPLNSVIEIYKESYPYLALGKYGEIRDILRKEADDYAEILRLIGNISDLKRYYNSFKPKKNWPNVSNGKIDLDGAALFGIRQSKGVSWKQMQLVAESVGYSFSSDTLKEYDIAYYDHQEKSRAGAEKKFGGHGLILDTGELKASTPEEMEKVIKLHTSTHLLHASLRKVLGEEVHQAGSDITAERLRFDFTFPRKLTPEEIKQVEDLVNGAIQKDYAVTKEEMSYEEAVKTGAL
ncbi:MAG: alanine--tRNA ligase-related protein, partial [Patescibacteria group bacterium]